jgi:hypothetical protein
MRQTITINNVTWGNGDNTGLTPIPTTTVTKTVMAFVQPTSTQDTLIYDKPSSTTVLDMFCSPTDTSGSAWTATQKDTVTYNGKTWNIIAALFDACTMQSYYKLVVDRDED